MTTTVYTIVDTTDDETYYHLGTYSTQAKAEAAIDELPLPPPVYFENSQPDTHCQVTIIEVLLDDWSDLASTVKTINWHWANDEDGDGDWKRS